MWEKLPTLNHPKITASFGDSVGVSFSVVVLNGDDILNNHKCLVVVTAFILIITYITVVAVTVFAAPAFHMSFVMKLEPLLAVINVSIILTISLGCWC